MAPGPALVSKLSIALDIFSSWRRGQRWMPARISNSREICRLHNSASSKSRLWRLSARSSLHSARSTVHQSNPAERSVRDSSIRSMHILAIGRGKSGIFKASTACRVTVCRTVPAAGALERGGADAEPRGRLLEAHAKVRLQLLQSQLLARLARVAAALAPPPPAACAAHRTSSSSGRRICAPCEWSRFVGWPQAPH